MIEVTYIPCLFEERRIRFKTRNLTPASILLSLIKKYPEVRKDSFNITIRINGKKVPPSQWRKKLNPGDRILITQEIGIAAPLSWAAFIGSIIGYGYTAYTVASILYTAFVVLTIASTIYSVVSTFSSGPSHGSKTSGNAPDSSPTYGWDGIRLQARAGIPVPIVYGEHLVGGNLLSAFITSDGEKNYLNMLIALCEGEIEGIMKEDLSGVCQSNGDTPYILINGNPLSNYSGIWWDFRRGTQNQDPIPGFEEIKNTYSTGGILLSPTGYIYTTTDSNIEAFELRFRVPQIYQQYKGHFFATTQVYYVWHRVHGEADWVFDGEYAVSGCSQNTLRRYFRKDGLEPNRYDIKVSVAYASAPPWIVRDLYLDHVVEVQYDAIAYVHTALIGLKILATDQLSNTIPNVLTRIRGKKVKNLETNEIEWTQNPIYCVNDLIVNERYGLGRFIAQSNIDIDQLVEQAHHHDETVGNGVGRDIDGVTSTSLTDNDYLFVNGDIGKTICVKSPNDATIYTNLMITSISGDGHTAYGTGGWSEGTPSSNEKWEWGEKRSELDIVIDYFTNGINMVQTVCASFRAVPLWVKDAIQIITEKKESPAYIFNMGNIIAGTYRHVGASEKKRPNVIEIDFANRDRNFERETVEVDEKEAFFSNLPRKTRKLSLIGASRLSQIYREGRAHLRAAQYQDESITFKAGIDAIACLPGEVVKFQHDVPQYGYGGRIVSATINSVTIDQEVHIAEGYNYVVTVKLPGSGGEEYLETRQVTNAPGYYNQLQVSPNFSAIPPAWGVYLFGKENLEAKLFRIMRVGKTPENELEVEATEYSDQCYIDTDVILPSQIYSDLPNPAYIPNVTNLEAREGGTVLGDGTWAPYIEISFKKPESSTLLNWSHAEVYISNTPHIEWFEYYGKTDQDHSFKIENHPFLKIGNTIRIKVVSVAKNGVKSDFATAPYVDEIVNGKTTPPSDISQFNVLQMGDKLIFSWSPVEDRDVSHYEIREGATWEVSQVISQEVYGTNFTLFAFTGGAKNYMIKAVDNHGNYSLSPAMKQITVLGSSITNLVKDINCLLNANLSDLMAQYGYMGYSRLVSLKPTQGWDDEGIWDDGSKWDVPVYPLTGYLETEQIDMGMKKVWMIVLDDNYLMDGDGQTAQVQIRTSDNGTDWTSYSTYTPGEYNCRYFQLKCTLTTDNENENIFITRFWIQAGDSKLFTTRFTNVSIAVGGTTINYGYTYGSTPAITITPVGNSALIPVITAQTATYCTIRVFNTGGSDVGGTVNIIVEGY